MSPRAIRLAALLLALGAGLLWLRSYLSEAAQVRRALGKAVRAVEKRDLLGTAGLVSRRYSDPWGQSYESLLAITSDVYSSHTELDFSLRIDSVVVSGPLATAEVRFHLAGRRTDGTRVALVGSFTEPATAVLELRKGPRGWLLEGVRESSLAGPRRAPPGPS